MPGYQEILTDPSYKGQIVLMTYPHIGNYGVNPSDVESQRPWAEGLIVRELSALASHHTATQSLGDYLRDHRIVGIQGIDTRYLTQHLRQAGAMRGLIATTGGDPQQLLATVQRSPQMTGRDLVPEVTCKRTYTWNEPSLEVPESRTQKAEGSGQTARSMPDVVVIDFGVKRNILRRLVDMGCRVTVVPGQTTADDILAQRPDGVVLSNGPGDPSAVTYGIATAKQLLGRVPLFGICLGHQILGLALGGKTYKLKFGHHGANHPVKDLRTGRVAITSQNHGFAVDFDAVPDTGAQLTHVNLNDQTVEGFTHPARRLMSVQYHPEASPGPHDAGDLFAQFAEMM